MKCVPKLDTQYWLTIGMASIFGANTGDYLADGLNLGHLDGIPALVAVFAAILLAEAFLKFSSAVYYWAAVIVVRAAATNIGDIFHDFRISFAISIPLVLVLLLAALLVWRLARKDAFATGVIPVNAFYWVTMFLAGTLGTVVGDWASYPMQLGNLVAAIVLAAPLAIMLPLGWKRMQTNLLYFWALIVLIRSSGTAAGDYIAHSISLPLATAVTGLVFAAIVLLFYGIGKAHSIFKVQTAPA
jgi:uncharacterized membrane-anchored protein